MERIIFNLYTSHYTTSFQDWWTKRLKLFQTTKRPNCVDTYHFICCLTCWKTLLTDNDNWFDRMNRWRRDVMMLLYLTLTFDGWRLSVSFLELCNLSPTIKLCLRYIRTVRTSPRFHLFYEFIYSFKEKCANVQFSGF